MQRFLVMVIAALLLLLLVSSVQRHRAAPVQRSDAAARAPAASPRVTAARDSAREAARALLARDAGQTYLDSMLFSTDSLVRRWPDRGGAPFRVAMVEGGSADYQPRLAGFVRRAGALWEGAGVGFWFAFTTDSGSADIVVRWTESFGNGNQAGVTDLRWANSGAVVRAYVSLATRNVGDSLFNDDALLGAAIHELGHAMGMPHSTDSTDVMFPVTRALALSPRDRATARLLYTLPPGSLRAPRPR